VPTVLAGFVVLVSAWHRSVPREIRPPYYYYSIFDDVEIDLGGAYFLLILENREALLKLAFELLFANKTQGERQGRSSQWVIDAYFRCVVLYSFEMGSESMPSNMSMLGGTHRP
jgi:hypothetical protein